MLRHLGDAGPPSRILAIGGSTRNHLLMRLKATVYGLPLEVLDLPDTTCLGAALLGGLAAGVFADLDEARGGLRVPGAGRPPDGRVGRRPAASGGRRSTPPPTPPCGRCTPGCSTAEPERRGRNRPAAALCLRRGLRS